MLRLFSSVLKPTSRPNFTAHSSQAAQFITQVKDSLSADEILQLITHTNQPEGLAFGLRGITQFMTKDQASLEPLLSSPEYFSAKSRALQHLGSMKSQEVADLCFWARVMHKNGKGILTPKDNEALSSRIVELLEDLNAHQAIAIFFDISVIGRSISLLEKRVFTILKSEALVSMLDMKLVLACLNIEHHHNYYGILRSIRRRLLTVVYDQQDNFFLIELICHLQRHYWEDPQLKSPLAAISITLSPRIKTFAEDDILRLFDFSSLFEQTPSSFVSRTLRSVESRLNDDPFTFSCSFYHKLGLSLAKDRHEERFVQCFAKAALARYRKEPNYARNASLLEVLAVFSQKVPEELVKEAIEVVTTTKDVATPFDKFTVQIALNNFPYAERLFGLDELRSAFSELDLLPRIEALVKLASAEMLTEEWADLLDELETQAVEGIKAEIKVNRVLNKFKLQPEVLYSPKLLKLKLAVRDYSDLTAPPHSRRQSEFISVH
jgi:hypothetical protein